MNKVMSRKVILAGAVLFLGMPAIAAATGGLIGDCADCHTMHNSEQGQAVAKLGTTDTVTVTPIENLLRMDCMACHAVDPAGTYKIVDLGGGSAVPQVLHADTTGDLAGGNFSYVITDGRKGHNVIDLMAASTDNLGTYGAPPGKYRPSTHGGAHVFTDSANTSFAKFTCAGSGGCHGTRNQALSAFLNTNITGDTVSGTFDGPDFYENGVRRVGIAAISGAHHASQDGIKNPAQIAEGTHSGAEVAAGYRFIPGLKGAGNETARWQNVDASNHNEYYGNAAKLPGSGCGVCHLGSGLSVGSHLYLTGKIQVPNQSVSGFCGTCHGAFHSVGAAGNTLESSDAQGPNGVSGAFLRHPSDYVIPSTGEYSAYTAYSLTAPVARPDITAGVSGTVTPGTDMVMCMSCHMAHGSQYDAMLRFDYTEQQAGNAAAGLGVGCLACHTSKGILPENR
jgi:Zn-finger protein